MTILIIEDEIHNFRLLSHMLQELVPDAMLIGPAYSIQQTRRYLENVHDIDLIIADIQLSDGLSFDALRYAPDDIPIIFTTAYDEHALRAFEFNSLSYLLKPIDEDELAKALRKVRRLRVPQGNAYDSLLPNLLSHADTYRERFVVKTPRGEKVIPLFNVRYIVSEQKTTYIKLHDGTSYSIDISLEKLATQLDPSRFIKVNRKYIVPLNQIAEILTLPNGKARLILEGDNVPEIKISRDQKKRIILSISSFRESDV